MLRDDSHLPSRDKVFEILNKQDIAKVVITFSGGNDSGGCDSLTAYKADGSLVAIPETRAHQDHHSGQYMVYNPGIPWSDPKHKRPATEQEIEVQTLRDALEKPVYDRYYSFAGEFEVQGELIWDVARRKVTMDKQETQWVGSQEDV